MRQATESAPAARQRQALDSLLRDPLVHFIVLGAAIFGLFAVLDRASPDESRRIVVSEAEIASLWQAMAMLYGQAPTEAELYQLVEPMIREEVLYREALALGLDRDDSRVRQRLVEKMTFLTDDLFAAHEPMEEELEAFFEANGASFDEPARVSFEQLYFSPSLHGESLVTDAEAALRRLAEGGEVRGDESGLAPALEDVSEQELRAELGQSFAAEVLALDADGAWHGPLRSQFGVHLVRLSGRSEARRPRLDEVREQVVEALLRQRRQQANDAAYAQLRDRYEIVIELPEVARAAWQP
ncbi:MAG TPA: peptidylprolyl isomerase [Gammaproteobacteria bacterium]|jgi:hypothetical protein